MVVDAHVGDTADEALIGAAARAHAERLSRTERLIDVVEIYMELGGPAVDVHLHAARETRPIVREEHMMPTFALHARVGMHADRIVKPALHQVDVNLAVLKNEA